MPLDFPNSPTANQVYEQYRWNATDSVWNLNLPEYVPSYEFDYLVIAGGGGGGEGEAAVAREAGGGGGAGGYRTSTGTSGGTALAEPKLVVLPGTYTVTVGAGGAGATTLGSGASGSNSVFYSIRCFAGGGGARSDIGGLLGGSGGGAGANANAFSLEIGRAHV